MPYLIIRFFRPFRRPFRRPILCAGELIVVIVICAGSIKVFFPYG